MSDAAPVPPPGTAGSGTDPALVRYSVPEASRALGISERAVRKRIEAKTLLATREGRAWVVHLPGGTGTAPRPRDAVPRAVPAAPADAVAVPAVPAVAPVPGAVPPVDLRPLVDHIAALEGEVRQLTEAATMWQARAAHLEERLLQLGPGQEAAVARSETPGATGTPATEQGASGSVRRWWRRLVGQR